MAALGHTSTPFCFVVRQYLGFFPGQVHLSEVSFDDVHPLCCLKVWILEMLIELSAHSVCPVISYINLFVYMYSQLNEIHHSAWHSAPVLKDMNRQVVWQSVYCIPVVLFVSRFRRRTKMAISTLSWSVKPSKAAARKRPEKPCVSLVSHSLIRCLDYMLCFDFAFTYFF